MSLPVSCRFPVVGFAGSRSLGREWFPLVAAVVRACLAARRVVAVGCARGLDSFVREVAGPRCAVASVSRADLARAGRGAFALRSRRLVSAVAARRFFPGSAFVAFVSVPCPSGVVPAASWRSGRPPSGSWSSAALAAGSGLRLVVFWCSPGPPALPRWPGGRWVPVSSGPFASGWRWFPRRQPPFFHEPHALFKGEYYNGHA